MCGLNLKNEFHSLNCSLGMEQGELNNRLFADATGEFGKLAFMFSGLVPSFY